MNAELGRAIAARIRAAGPVSLADFMAEALSHPNLGYYRRGDPLGAAGDFITAPEISQIFGELIGLWLVDGWQRLRQPRPVSLVELGPGRGTLMADALRAARLRPEFIAAIHLHLVETSPGLRERQRSALSEFAPQWHKGLEMVPHGPILLIANEFFDALPIRQFEQTAKGWCERMIGLDDASERFRWVLAPPTAAVEALLSPQQRTRPVGTIAEVSPAARGLAAAIGTRVVAAPGVALVIDYGYDREGHGNTLQAVRQHAPADPLSNPGETDLTAHVDFSALSRAATAAGAETYGPVPQRDFLRALGIELRADRLCADAPHAQAEAIRSGVKRLIDPEEMGTLFRAMAIASPGFGPPAGFA
jgi:NADH dehydrogenase [ubiquinone] 1 alpha subcomplex assembly factor 7